MQEVVLPVKCSRCGALFDLWRELIREDKHTELGMALNGMGNREFTCPRCRYFPPEEAMEEEENEGISLSWENA